MKRIVTLIFLIFTFTLYGCSGKNIEAPESKKFDSENHSMPAFTENPTNTLDLDGYRLYKGQISESDEYGDIYYISHTSLNKILHDTGDTITLDDDFTFGKGLALYKQWIYYMHGTILCRVNTSGEDFHEFTSEIPYGISSFYIFEDNLFVITYSDEKGLEYHHSDISDNPDTLIFTSGLNGFNLDSFNEEAKEYQNLLSIKVPETQMSMPVQLIEKSDDYLYFSSTEGKFERMNLKTQEVEVLSISPFQIEKVTITSGWIFYNDKDGMKKHLRFEGAFNF